MSTPHVPTKPYVRKQYWNKPTMTWWERAYLPEKTKRTEFIEGKPADAAAKLVEKLRFDARVI